MDLTKSENGFAEVRLEKLKSDKSAAKLIEDLVIIEKDPPIEMKDLTSHVLYTVEDCPPWYLTILMALQHYLTFFGSAISLPFLLAPALCLSPDHPARAYLTSTLLFTFGILTLLQTTLGIRLPIVQGGSFAYLVPAFSILSLPQWQCPTITTTTTNVTFLDNAFVNSTVSVEEPWLARIRELQGDVALASILQILIGVTGAAGFVLRWITPLVIAPTVTLIGLSLFRQAAKLASKNWWISLGSIFFMTLFSQYLRNVKVPIPFYVYQKEWRILKYPLFVLLPVLLSIGIMWILCIVLTVTDVLPESDPARSDKNTVIFNESPWFMLPYPFQWGIPTISLAGVIGMMSAVVASVVESIGDYYACARLSDAPPPPVHAVNRGLFIEGLGGVLAGLWGTGVGATSFSQNIGAISMTKVASLRVIQVAAGLMIFFGIFNKMGAVFMTIPEPIVGGVYCIMFGIVTAVGISSVQFIDLNSSRNLFILGFSIFFGLAFPTWLADHSSVINTGNSTVDQVLVVLLSTNMLVGGILGFILDNTVPGTDEERGLLQWRKIVSVAGNKNASPLYDLPCGMAALRKWSFTKYFPICPTYRYSTRSGV